MAEKSPRPGEEEEDAEEEGEEAAEAPLRARRVVTEKDEDTDEQEEEASGPDSPLREAKEAAPGRDSRPVPSAKPIHPSSQKAVPEAPAHPHVLPAHPSVSPTFYAEPAVEGAYSSAAAPVSGMNLFANDGSFLELFKKKMEASSAGNKEETKVPEPKKPEPDKRKLISFVGKRRGGAKLALKTGIVTKKPKTEEEEILAHKGGAWAQYMAEVKKYKAHQCSDDDKTRPLVK